MVAPTTFSSSLSNGWTYDVFLSFRGQDTRYNFTGHLYKALDQRGIRTFIDDEELQRGDEITPTLEKAIEESQIAIIVLSKNYASSSFCLDELAYILKCIKGKGRLVLPIFYDVNPSDVRYQRETYAEALTRHKKFMDEKKVKNWKKALRQVANLSGLHFKHGETYEHEFIEKIVKEVARKIKCAALPVAHHPVGLDSREQHVISLLDVGSDDSVLMVGIHGIGGIGKTTLAAAVYNSISDCFECLCFLESVREKSNKHGLVYLQQNLLSELLGEKKIKLRSYRQGISKIQKRLQRKKVLLILDDVDNLQQLEALVGGSNWFGFGSRVIIITRYKHLLTSHGVERIYEVEDLNEKEALELLNWTAFKDDNIDPNYRDILNRIVAYASGLPLALEVIGSNLFGKSVEEWEYVFDRYKRVPNKQIQKILKVSFDVLEEEEQSVFLDIACCFRFYPLAEVKSILHAHHGDCMNHYIRVLVEKSLIKINQFDEVTLHDLIEDMGKEIVRQESLKEPGKRSRLWFPEDIVQVLEDNTGTSAVEMIHLNFPLFEDVEVKWDGEAFKKMENLKTLIIRGCSSFSNAPKHLPNSLRVLEWEGYPSKYLPHDFHPKKIVMCKLPDTSLKLVGLLEKRFENIKVLKIDRCECLTHIPNVSGLRNLEEFSFESCYNLIKIDDSIGFLDKLRILNASSCIKLRSIPPIKLTSLKRLELSYCSSLESFPEILGKMENMTELTIANSPLKGLPFSFRNLTRLQNLDIKVTGMPFWLPSSIVMMQELAEVYIDEMFLLTKLAEGEEILSSMVISNVEHLHMFSCQVSDETFPTCITWFANVKELIVTLDDNFTCLPECITECRFLKKLILNKCCRLREIRVIPPNLSFFAALDCELLTSSSRSMLLSQELHEAGNTFFCVPGSRTPEWFEHQSMGPSISFWFRNKMPVMALCFVIQPTDTDGHIDTLMPIVIINEKTMTIKQSDESWFYLPYPQSIDHIVIFGTRHFNFEDNIDEVLSKNEWNHLQFSIGLEESTSVPAEQLVNGTGLFVSEQENCMEDINFTNPALLKQGQRLGDIGDSLKQLVNAQTDLVSSATWELPGGQDRERLSLSPSKPFNDNVNLDLNLMASSEMNSNTDVRVKKASPFKHPGERENWEDDESSPKIKKKGQKRTSLSISQNTQGAEKPKLKKKKKKKEVKEKEATPEEEESINEDNTNKNTKASVQGSSQSSESESLSSKEPPPKKVKKVVKREAFSSSSSKESDQSEEDSEKSFEKAMELIAMPKKKSSKKTNKKHEKSKAERIVAYKQENCDSKEEEGQNPENEVDIMNIDAESNVQMPTNPPTNVEPAPETSSKSPFFTLAPLSNKDMEELVEIDPLAVIDNLLTNTLSLSSTKTQQSSVQVKVDQPQNPLAKKLSNLRSLFYDQPLLNHLRDEEDLAEKIQKAFADIEEDFDQLTTEQKKGVEDFKVIFVESLQAIEQGKVLAENSAKVNNERATKVGELQDVRVNLTKLKESSELGKKKSNELESKSPT